MNKFFKSFTYAYNGFLYAFKTQLNFRIHCVVTILVVLLGSYFRLSTAEWLWIILAIALVIILELINTSIEVLVDLVSPEKNHSAGNIKDLAAAAVLVASIMAFIIGLVIFVPKFF